MNNVVRSILYFHAVILLSCRTSQPVAGTYQTNFPEIGFFVTRVKFIPDSTFEYVTWGHSMYDSSTGNYQVLDHKIFLSAIWRKTGDYRFTRSERPTKVFRAGQDSATYEAFFFIGNDKLFFGDFETGKKITRSASNHKRKKYIFFGTTYYKKRWYLKRVT
jgi:hypothetical protein